MDFDISWAMTRATRSVGPPGGNGTIMVMDLEGNAAWAHVHRADGRLKVICCARNRLLENHVKNSTWVLRKVEDGCLSCRACQCIGSMRTS